MHGTAPVGVLLVNLGTPESPRAADVRRYLREFLSDPRVIDLPPLARWLLVNFVILPRRPAVSAAAYAKIWTERGSPLLVHTLDLAERLSLELGSDFRVEVAMRYGRPGVQGALDRLCGAGVGRIVVAPLYPQYSSASTGSTLEHVYSLAGRRTNVPPLSVLAPFFDHPGFLDSFAALGRPVLDDVRPDHVLFSFHGLPERHLRRSDENGAHCLASSTCCASVGPHNSTCYRAQAFETSRQLAARLGLVDGQYTVCFQSRFGRTRWIEPHTDVTVRELGRQGRRVVVFSPAFVADCLETLEEIGIRAREDFLASGGEAFALVPSLNAYSAWVQALATMVREVCR